MNATRLLGAAVAASLCGALWVAGHGGALLYAVLYVVAVLPGLPLGFALFGRRHPAAWIGGALLGYGLLQMAIWAVIVSHHASLTWFAIAWAVLTASTVAISRAYGREPAIRMPEWTTPDARALLLVVLLAPALMAPPYANLGRADAAGNRYYRAYFTADFLWHSALAFELGKFSLPPRNPYLAPRPMHYYWTYFLLPATTAQLASAPASAAATVQRCLKANAILTALLMIGALFLVVRSAVLQPWPAATAVALTVLAASAEGTYALVELIVHGRPFASLRELNVDAITAWRFDGMRIDNVPRSLWYTPQHTTAVAMGLIAWLIAATAGARPSAGAIAGAGAMLGLATTMNPLLGGCFSLVYGAAATVDVIRTRAGVVALLRHAAAAIPVLLAVLWGAHSKVMEGAGSALQLGVSGMTTTAMVMTLLLALGPILIPALIGLEPAADRLVTPVAIACAGMMLGLFLLYFVRISEGSWVGFRAGQLLLVSIPILLARALGAMDRRLATMTACAVLAVGLPTTLIDTWNAHDIDNREPGPGFRWTLWTTPNQQQAFAWIGAHTPADAIVQMEPIVRGREHWTLIPSFAGRRMAAGLPISLLPQPEYETSSDQVKTLFATTDADEAAGIARRLRIDYLYVDETDVAAYPEGVRKFDEQPALFARVFSSGDVKVYRVN